MRKLSRIALAGLLCLMAFSVFAQETRTYFVTNAVGSPVVTTDEGGNLTWEEDYLPYGERRYEGANADSSDRWFTSAPQNSDSGLVDLGNRMYDPVVGRFYGIDPVGVSASKPNLFNRYAYANNNPFRYSDSDGREGADVRLRAQITLLHNGQRTERQYLDWGREQGKAGLIGAGIVAGVATEAWILAVYGEPAALLAAYIASGGDPVIGPGRFGRVRTGTVDPKTIRFVQDSIGSTFRDGRSVRSLIDDLRSGRVTAAEVPAIRVFRRDGETFTLDNRRLYAFQEAGVQVRTVSATAQEVANESYKFTTRNGGTSVRVRGGSE